MKLKCRILDDSELNTWFALREQSEQSNVFNSDWWMNWTTNKEWKIIGCFDGIKLVGGMPIWEHTIFGENILSIPPFTQSWGPIILDYSAKYVRIISREHSIQRCLVEYLSKWNHIELSLHPSIHNCLPYKWNGFQEFIRYTYIIDDLSNLDEIWNNLDTKTSRNMIKQAQKSGIKVVSDVSLDVLLQLFESTFKRQGISKQYMYSRIRRLYKAATKVGNGKIIGVKDTEDNIVAASLLIWDDRSSYNILNGQDYSLRNVGANNMLMWELIKYSSKVTRKFNFEGSMIEGVEAFYRSFGAKRTLYIVLKKHDSFKIQLLNMLKRNIKKAFKL
jgi:hypothetical protein